jgi:phosphomannomutase
VDNYVEKRVENRRFSAKVAFRDTLLAMDCPKAAVFDLDDTLAESFKPPRPEMTARLKQVLEIMPVAIMTGRDFARIEPNFLPDLVENSRTDRFFLFTESTTLCFQYSGSAWTETYAFKLTDEERAIIRAAIEQSVEETHVLDGLPCFGDRILEKHAQTAYAMLGIQVPSELKYTWDPGNVRRKLLQTAVAQKLPDFEVLLGGATSIDVTKKGMEKSYGVRWLSEKLGIPPQEMLYIGDALTEGGNDFVVIPTGIQTRQTIGPEETLGIIDELLASCSAK